MKSIRMKGGSLLTLLSVLLCLVACSSKDEPVRKIKTEDLYGTIWEGEELILVRHGDSYSLKVTNPKILYQFLANNTFSKTVEDQLGFYHFYEGRYEIQNDIFLVDNYPEYKILYTPNKLELIKTATINSTDAKESGYGFKSKIVLRRR